MKHLSPADYVIHIFGGVRATGRAIGITGQAVSYWRKQKSRGGKGGRIPRKAQAMILSHALLNGFDITANDFLHGRKVHIPKKPIWET